MKTWVRKSLNVGVLSAGFLLVSGGAAHADWTTGYNAGLLNGNQFDTTLQVPVNVCGNSIAVLGFADAHCGGGATAVKTESASATESATTEDWTTGYNAGVANGNQLDTTLQVPVNISGNAVSVLGFSSASSSGGATAVKGGVSADNDGHGRRHHRGGNGNGNGGYNAGGNGSYSAGSNGNYATEGVANRTEDWTSGYNAGLLNGNQFDTTAQLPINVSGNAIALLGFAGASSQGGAWAVKGESATTESAQATESDHTTGYNAGLLNGNQLDTTLQLPINLCGNSIAILGFASANCGGGATAVKGDVNGGGQGGDNGWGHGHGHHHGGNGNGQGDGGYGNGSDNGDNGYGADTNGNSNAYPHSSGNASDVKANNASAKAHMHKAKTSNHKSVSLDEHAKKNHKGTGAGLSPASDNGYGGGSGVGDDNGYGNGQNNGGYDNGSGQGNGDDNHGRRHHRHHGGNGSSNGGGATAVKGGCGDWTTGFNAGLLNGNQFDTTVQVPVNISGNAISLLGFSNASSSGGALAYSC
ncbi:chaplin family protein [Dactylosporangium salmoneum]|uniref:Chaplin domain-containing protein n=1 Tax=Dactylosporangium salmoneum TaxID=53361 RepID=A0ABN3H3C2_9ACTN